MADLRRPSRARLRNDIPHRANRAPQNLERLAATHPITAAVQFIQADASNIAIYGARYDTWQEESWAFYESLGEFTYGVEWFSEALSRCRLNVAEMTPGGDEPEILDSGPATDIIEQLAGGINGQAAMMKSFATQLSVAGECYLIGNNINTLDNGDQYEAFTGVLLDAEPDESGHVWTVQPTSSVRPSQKTFMSKFLGRERRGWEVQIDDISWVPLGPESLIVRVWDRDEHRPWKAFSQSRGALTVMREIDMYNRYIMATLISRVALNGVWLIPEEVVLPANPAYEDQQDPFFAELLDVMRQVIKNPGSPASAAPLPLRVPSELIDKFKHLTFATPLDNQIYNAREGALKRLAASLNLPQEVITGMAGMNHWGSYQLEESAIKIHISPKVELITRCLTIGYLYPMLRAINEPIVSKNGNRLVVWYDTSPLTQRPDRSELALNLNDRIIISDEATRRETGFTEGDKPTDDERDMMLQRKLVLLGGQQAGAAYEKLTGEPLSDQPPGIPGMPGTAPGTQVPATGISGLNSGPGGLEKPVAGAPASTTAQGPQASQTPSRATQRLPQTRNQSVEEANARR